MLLSRLFQSFRAAWQKLCSSSKCCKYLVAWNLKHNFLAGSERIFCLMTCQTCSPINRKHDQVTDNWISARPSPLSLLCLFVFCPSVFAASVKRGSVASSIECHVCPHSFNKSESYRINISTIKVLDLFFVWWIFNHLVVSNKDLNLYSWTHYFIWLQLNYVRTQCSMCVTNIAIMHSSPCRPLF